MIVCGNKSSELRILGEPWLSHKANTSHWPFFLTTMANLSSVPLRSGTSSTYPFRYLLNDISNVR